MLKSVKSLDNPSTIHYICVINQSTHPHMTDNYKAQQKAFLNVVNRFGGLPPTFKFDPAHEEITLVYAPHLFLSRLIESGASLNLSTKGVSVVWYSFPNC